MTAPRTKAELLSENQHLRERLAAMVPPDYSQEIASLKAQLAALQAKQPEPYIMLQRLHAPGIPLLTLWRWARRKEIEAKKILGRWYGKQSSVDARIERLRGRQTR
jgi:hypothetical protein